MEFFSWLDIPQVILQFIPITAEDSVEVASKLRMSLLICFAVAAAFYLVGLVMGGIGLYTIGKRAGIKHPWLGFIPFANTWYAGKIAGEASFFGQKMKRAGLYAMIFEIVFTGLKTFVWVAYYLLLRPEYFALQTNAVTGAQYWGGPIVSASDPHKWLDYVNDYGEIASYLLWFLIIIFLCVLFTAFFRKYYTRGPLLMTFLCTLLPFRGFAIFAVRKNAPMNYDEYLRRRAEEYARRVNPYGGYNNGGYNNGGNNNGGNNNGGGNGAPDPFSDFGNGSSGDDPSKNGPPKNGPDPGGDDPFSEFN